jgi:hypothetical protein
MRCLTRTFNAMSLHPFNASLHHRAPSTRHYIVAPLQRVIQRAPSTHRSTRPFNALFNAPLQCVIQCAPSTRCLTWPFNTAFDVPLQRDIVAPIQRDFVAPLQRVVQRAPSTHRHCAPLLLQHIVRRALQRVVNARPSTRRRRGAPFHALYTRPSPRCRCPLQRVVIARPSAHHRASVCNASSWAPFTTLLARPFTLC